MKIPTDKIREVIGKVIREIVEKTGAKVDSQDDGTVKVASSSGAAITAALNWIKGIMSELAPKRVAKVSDMVNEGDMVKVKLLGFDNRGKVRLSMKQVDQVTGEDLSKKQIPVEEAEPQEAAQRE